MPISPPIQLIRQTSQRYGIDPRAAIAVARGEGGLVNREDDIGDLAGGGSYGPFQLYAQGALPSQYRGNPAKADSWAWSPEGIEYAIRKMAEAGARGLTGPQAVETIIRKFERPADPDKSVAAALARLGGGSGGPAPSAGGGSASSGSAPPPGVMAPSPLGGEDFHMNLINAFSQKGGDRTSAILGAILNQGRSGTAQSGSAPMAAAPGAGASTPSPSRPVPPNVSPSGAYGAQGMVSVIEQAKRMGLAVSENPYAGDKVDPVHTEGSHHYRTIGEVGGRPVGGGADISGDPQKLQALFAWIRRRYPKIPELIYDPVGSVFDGTWKPGPYGGHESHVHAGF